MSPAVVLIFFPSIFRKMLKLFRVSDDRFGLSVQKKKKIRMNEINPVYIKTIQGRILSFPEYSQKIGIGACKLMSHISI